MGSRYLPVTIFLGFSLFFLQTPLFAAPRPTIVKVQKRNSQTVILKVRIPKKFRRGAARFEIQYAPIGGMLSATEIRRSSRRRSAHRKLKIRRTIGAFSSDTLFRVRAKTKRKGETAWSKFVLLAIAPTQTTPAPTPLPLPTPVNAVTDCPVSVVKAAIDETNARRVLNGIPPLQELANLNDAASLRAAAMAESQVLEHGSWVQETLQSVPSSFGFSRYSQNIARFFESPSVLLTAWMGSANHQQNILDTEVTHLGMGCSISVTGEYWWAQNFAG